MFSIDHHVVGDGRVFVIGEVAQAHDGKLHLAHEYIDAIADAGADAVKFQTHIAAAESTLDEPFRIAGPWPAPNRFAYWQLMEFSEGDWCELAAHARSRRLVFLSSPFSIEAAELLERVQIPAWKIASGELLNEPLLAYLARSRRPVLLSTGLASEQEVDAAIQLFRRQDCSVAVFQTTSKYPCPPEDIGLNVIGELRRRYQCPVGLSDHSGTIYAGLAAAALGADLLEVHVTLSREATGPDVTSSITPAELRQLTDGIRFIERMRLHPVDKPRAVAAARPVRALFTRSVATRVDLPAGTVLADEHLALRKPGTGIPAARRAALVGRKLTRAVAAHTLLREEDLE